jgi:membrane protein
MKAHSVLLEFLQSLQKFPWRNTALTLGQRFREDRLGLTASSLTFTTLIALVPFFTVMLAIFSAFPMFAKFQGVLQQWLIDSLIPDSIAKQVMGYVTTFASKASRLGAVGLGLLVVTAIALMLTIDKTLNAIWRVKKPRPLSQRVLVYWAAITLGPLLLAGSLALTSYLVSASRGVVAGMPGGVKFLLGFLQFVLFSAGLAAMFRFVPNTQVRWSHALTGGIFVSLALEAAQSLLTLYIKSVPTYSTVYGAFATLPILLLWVYIAWLVVLFGAVIAAYLPSLLGGVARRSDQPGWRFMLALEILQLLDEARRGDLKGLSSAALAARMKVDLLELGKPLDVLSGLDWIGHLEMQDKAEDSRWVLLGETAAMPLVELERRLLLTDAPSLQAYARARMGHSLPVADVLGSTGGKNPSAD